MKYLFFALLLTLTLPLHVQAGELGVKLINRTFTSDDDMFHRGSAPELELSYMGDKGGYVFLSKSTTSVYYKDYAFDLDLTGVGAGAKFKITDNIRLFGQVGYYIVTNSWGDRKREFNEALHYYLNDRYKDSNNHGDYYRFESFAVETEDAIGGTVGIEMNYPITKNLNTSISMSYNVIAIHTRVIGFKDSWNYESTGANWQTGGVRDYSSTNFGLGLNYTF